MIPGHYLVLAGRRAPGAAEEMIARSLVLAPGLVTIHATPTCLVMVDRLLPHALLQGGRGVIMGRLHGPDEAGVGRNGAGICSGWQAVVRDNWGDFIVIEQGDEGQDMQVARSAMGGLPCYHMVHDGLVVLSNAPRLIEAVTTRLTIDVEALMHHMLCVTARGSRTCLLGLCELLAGHWLAVGQGRAVALAFWDPWRHAGRTGQRKDLALSAPVVRENVLDATRRTVSGHRHILLGLSGGLDSSILAASLAAARVDFSCFTLVTPDGTGDERRYARMVARHLGRPLHEIEESPGDVDIAHSAAAHLPRPVARCFAQSGDRIQMALACELGADAYMSGGGGDNIFCYVHSARPLADRLLSEGPGRGAWQTARDIALLTDSPQWKVMMAGIARSLWGSRDYRWSLDRQYLGPGAADNVAQDLGHDWMRAPSGELPGKAQHIAWILGVLNHVEGFEREHMLPTLWPLLAQPVVETCLSIPTWSWLSGGQNRVIAREAFADLLPPDIVSRRSKGSPDSFVITLFEEKKAQIATFLCEGWLAEQGLIDADAIARRCRQEGFHRDASCWKLFGLVDAESWARAWLDSKRYARAALGQLPSL